MEPYHFFQSHKKDKIECKLVKETPQNIADKLPSWIRNSRVRILTLHVIRICLTCARTSFNFLRKSYTLSTEDLYTFYGRAINFLRKSYTLSTEELYTLYGTAVYFLRNSSTYTFLRKRSTFSTERLYIFYGSAVCFLRNKRVPNGPP